MYFEQYHGIHVPLCVYMFRLHLDLYPGVSLAFRQQSGSVRTNCVDCLDRTNAVQTLLGLEVNLRLFRLVFAVLCGTDRRICTLVCNTSENAFAAVAS